MNEEFRKIFEKFAFTDVAASEVMSWFLVVLFSLQLLCYIVYRLKVCYCTTRKMIRRMMRLQKMQLLKRRLTLILILMMKKTKMSKKKKVAYLTRRKRCSNSSMFISFSVIIWRSILNKFNLVFSFNEE